MVVSLYRSSKYLTPQPAILYFYESQTRPKMKYCYISGLDLSCRLLPVLIDKKNKNVYGVLIIFHSIILLPQTKHRELLPDNIAISMACDETSFTPESNQP